MARWTPASSGDVALPRFQRYLPDTACDATLTDGHAVTRTSVTMFADIAGFTSLSEDLARFGTAGTEQVGGIVRTLIGGALDVVARHGGDALAFGGDAITVAFGEGTTVDDAQRAAAEVVALFEGFAGTPTLVGPVAANVRVGIARGRVTTLLCASDHRDVLVLLGPGLDRAAEASGAAAHNGIRVDDPGGREDGVAGSVVPPPARPEGAVLEVPAWAPRAFHPLTASRIAAAAEPPDEHRRVTCVFLSLPATDDRDPVALARLADLVAAAADSVAEADGEVVQCSGGDKGIVLYAVFGAPVAHPDDALRAVHAVDRLRASTRETVTAGIATGLAFTAVFGGRTRGFFSAIGDTANVAARLMTAAQPGTTLLDSTTAEACDGHLVLDEPRSLHAKNRAEPIAAVRLRRVSSTAPRLDDEGESPLVGRDAELALVEQLLDGVRTAGSSLHLVGEAGSGKSRLAAELVRRARVRGLPVRVGGFEVFAASRPFGPFPGFLRERPGAERLRTADDLREAIRAVRPGDEGLAPLLGALLDLDVAETGATAALTEDQRSELGRRLVVDLLCGTPTPTLLVVEDAHWADEASRSLLADLVPRLPASRLSVVTTRRPGPLPRCEPTVTLQEMPPERLATIVRDTWSRLGGSTLPDPYVDEVVARSAGSPLFAQTVTELVRRAYRAGVPLPDVPLPDQLLPFLTAQLDTLGDSAQQTALRAAVLGRAVTAEEIARIFEVPPPEVAADVARLVGAGILRPGQRGEEEVVALRHATVAEALVARAAHAVRAPMHERVARYLVASAASAREVAGHLEHCRLPELEHSWYRFAREEAAAAWAQHEARRWAELALATAPAGRREPDLLALAELEQQLGDLDEAAARLVGLKGAGAERLRGRIALETGRPADAVAHLQEAERLGASGPDVSWPLTMALCDLARFDEAAARAAHQLAAAEDDAALRLDALANLGVIEARQGRFDAAAGRLGEAQQLAAECGDTLRWAIVTGDLAGTCYALDRIAEAADLLGQAAATAERLGSRRLVAMTLGNAAALRLEAGDLDGARRAAAASTRGLLALGDVALALNTLQVPVLAVETEGDCASAASWWRRHAELEELMGRPADSAVSWFRHAAALAGLGRVSAAETVVAGADVSAAELDDEDVRVERERALTALGGAYAPPVDRVADPVELPPLDAGLPAVSVADVDDLFDAVEQLLTEREAAAA